MEVTRVVFYVTDRAKKPLAVCSVILDDELRLNDIQLFKNENGYFLTLPSKQDIYQDVENLNKGLSVVFPKNALSCNGKKRYEEFFHPLCNTLYKKVLNRVVMEYEKSIQ